jgi:hypothetical protein
MSETIIRTVYKPLSDSEKIEIADKIARFNIEIESMIETKKNLPKQIEGKQELAAQLSHEYETGKESEDVECFCKLDDPEPGKKTFYAIEDNRLVETIDMIETEKAPLFEQQNEEEMAEEIFSKIKSEFENDDKTFISCHEDLFVEKICLDALIPDAEAREIFDTLAKEYFDLGVTKKEQQEFILVEKASYPAFKKLLKTVFAEHLKPEPMADGAYQLPGE